MTDVNNQLVLICGYSATGKSASLRNIRDQQDWVYINSEAGKRLPFKNDFMTLRLDDPETVMAAFDEATNTPSIKGIIVDSLTFLMDMYESQYVLPAANTMKGWSNYNQFFKRLLQEKVVKFGRPVIFTAHVMDTLDEKTMEMRTAVPVKGALKGQGVEAYFSTIVAAKKVPIKELEDYNSDLLHITEEEKELGFKYVFQTRITAKSTGERIRSPMGLFSRNETYMDNDAQILLDHLNKFYS